MSVVPIGIPLPLVVVFGEPPFPSPHRLFLSSISFSLTLATWGLVNVFHFFPPFPGLEVVLPEPPDLPFLLLSPRDAMCPQ